jgi:hypothetical protein
LLGDRRPLTEPFPARVKCQVLKTPPLSESPTPAWVASEGAAGEGGTDGQEGA